MPVPAVRVAHSRSPVWQSDGSTMRTVYVVPSVMASPDRSHMASATLLPVASAKA